MSVHTFEHAVAGRPRRFVVQHDPLRDRVAVEVDGAPVPTNLVRRPFSNLWRYTFTVDGDALEVRVRASGLRGIDVTLVPSQAPVAAARVPASALALAFAAVTILAVVALPGPITVRAVIGIVAGALTTAVVAIVYRRA